MTPEPPAGDPAADPAQRRRAFRAFVRSHHPDVGGDPALFAAGLQAWRHPEPAPSGVVFHRRRRGVAVLIGWWRDRRRRAGRPRVL